MSTEHRDKKQRLVDGADVLLELPSNVWPEVLSCLELSDVLALASTCQRVQQKFETKSELWQGLRFSQRFSYWARPTHPAQKLLARYRDVWSRAGVRFAYTDLCSLTQLVLIQGLHFAEVNLLGFSRKLQEVLEDGNPHSLQKLRLFGSLRADRLVVYEMCLRLEHWPQNVSGLAILCRALGTFDRQQLRMPPIPTLRAVRFSLSHPNDEGSPDRLCQEFLTLPPELEELTLVDCGFTPEQFRRLLARFRALQKLVLVEDQRPGTLANPDFTGCTSLRVLNVTGFASIGIRVLQHAQNLCELYLYGCGWSGNGPELSVSEAAALETLWVDGPRSNLISLRDLPTLRRLQTLALDNLPAGQIINLLHLTELELSELQELSLTFRDSIARTSPARFSNYFALSRLPKLEVVNFAKAAPGPAMRVIQLWFEHHLPNVELNSDAL